MQQVGMWIILRIRLFWNAHLKILHILPGGRSALLWNFWIGVWNNFHISTSQAAGWEENLYTHPPLNTDRHIVQTAGRLKNQTHPTNALLLLLSIQVSKYFQVFSLLKCFKVSLYHPRIKVFPSISLSAKYLRTPWGAKDSVEVSGLECALGCAVVNWVKPCKSKRNLPCRIYQSLKNWN